MGSGNEPPLSRPQLLLKCADISNVAQRPAASLEWAVNVTDELFAQGDMERDQGMQARPKGEGSHGRKRPRGA